MLTEEDDYVLIESLGMTFVHFRESAPTPRFKQTMLHHNSRRLPSKHA